VPPNELCVSARGLSSQDGDPLEPRPPSSPDLERSLRFYEDTLSLAVYREWGEGKTRGVVSFLGGGLLEVSSTPPEPPSDAVRLFLQVRDLPAVRERLAERGVPIEEEPEVKPWGLFEMVARDPDGLALVFVEVPPEHPLRRRR
jgi:catechol 2,3-dioxygenase-like lactoylglutathione lyase family enzyme